MPYFPHTPEALLGRNDSKNPTTTCQGITSSGRPCRRALALSKTSPSTRDWASNNVYAKDESLESEQFCWQHKSQVEKLLNQKQRQYTEDGKNGSDIGEEPLPILQERNSIDTLMQKLEIRDDDVGRNRRSKHGQRQRKHDVPHDANKELQGNLRVNAVPNPGGNMVERPHIGSKPKQQRKRQGFWASICCVLDQKDEGDYLEVVRHRRQTHHSRPEMAGVSSWPTSSALPPRPLTSARPSRTSLPARKPVTSDTSARPAAQRSTSNPHTAHLLSLIPQFLSPTITAALMAELVKPISPYDEEGYIYIFWLTPQYRNLPSEDAAQSLLTPPSRSCGERRVSDVMTEFSYDGPTDGLSAQNAKSSHTSDISTKKMIKLKIGRANNITRRMNEWQRQCGHALTLVRWYPYVSSTNTISSATSSPNRRPNRQPPQPSLYPDLTHLLADSSADAERRSISTTSLVKKVTFVKRVERLIHIELADKQIKRNCETCGKEHREWFEIEASQAGIRGVDECIRRWVAWAERKGNSGVVA